MCIMFFPCLALYFLFLSFFFCYFFLLFICYFVVLFFFVFLFLCFNLKFIPSVAVCHAHFTCMAVCCMQKEMKFKEMKHRRCRASYNHDCEKFPNDKLYRNGKIFAMVKKPFCCCFKPGIHAQYNRIYAYAYDNVL